MTTHTLKCLSPWFEALADGSKTFEVRWNDRDFRVGDELVIEHWEIKHQQVFGRLRFTVTYVYHGFGPGAVKRDLQQGYVVLGIRPTP
jgi:hypothetical protein